MKPEKIIPLTGEHEIPGIPYLKYVSEAPFHWIAIYQDFEIYFYGDRESPQLERIPVAQKVMPCLSEIEWRAKRDVNKHFNSYLSEWQLAEVYFGFAGTESFDEFSLHFILGIWDSSDDYYVRYQLDSEEPVRSILNGFGHTDR